VRSRDAIVVTLVAAGALACDLFFDPPSTGGIQLQVRRSEASAPAAIDGARARIIGPGGGNSQTSVVTLTLRGSSAFVDTVGGLAPGSYTVALEGLTAGAVAEFGEIAGVTVTVGQNTAANITVGSFEPSFQVTPGGNQLSAQVVIQPVGGAAQYVVSRSRVATFASARDTTVVGTTVGLTFDSVGTYFVRARAVNTYSAAGVWSDSTRLDFDLAAVTTSITPGSRTLTSLGDTARLAAVARDANGNAIPGEPINWSTSDGGVATVGSDGVVSAVGNGSATITARADTASGTASMTVAQVVATVTLNGPAGPVSVGGQYLLAAQARDARGNVVAGAPLTWSSSDTTVATVSVAGLMVVKAVGTTTITVESGTISAATPVEAQVIPIPNSGLIAYFPFSGDADDVAAERFSTVVGATLTQDRFGAANRAYAFDGVDDYIVYGNHVKPPFPFSISLWAFPSDTSKSQAQEFIVGDTTWGAGTFDDRYQGFKVHMTFDPSGGIRGQFGNGGIPSGANRREQSTVDPVLGTDRWHHIAVVFAAAADIRIYVDGVQRATENGPGTAGAIAYSARPGTIGAAPPHAFYEGSLDDIRVFGRALSGQEVAALAGEGALGPPVDSVAISADSTTIEEGYELGLLLEPFDSAGNRLLGVPVTWSPSDSTIARVNRFGTVHGLRPGTVTIRAEVGPLADSMAVTVRGPAAPFRSISSAYHTCAISGSGIGYCWGANSFGQLGNASLTPAQSPSGVTGGLTFDSLVAGGNMSCGLVAGAAYCWGHNNLGQVGDSTSGTDRVAPTAVVGGLAFTRLDVGADYVCGLLSGGKAYCWGYNSNGALGNGGTANRSYPDSVHGGLRYTQVDGGLRATCAIAQAGGAYCWGRNNNGQAGLGTVTADRTTPTAVSGSAAFASISTGGDANGGSACAVDNVGSGFCWGRNTNGQLGDNSTTQRLLPVPVAGGLTWRKIEVGADFACGVTTAGIGYCWGDDAFGQLGDGAILADKATPQPVFGGRVLLDLEVGSYHACAMAVTGALYCWGQNSTGGLGDGTTTDRSIPTRVRDP